jgi:sRNA-binding carbon storage regulator CsrA
VAQQMVTTKVIGLEKLHVKLGEEIPQEYKRMMFHIRGSALKAAKAKAKPHPGDVGSLAASIKGAARVQQLSARIWTNLPVAVEVEQGRRPESAPGYRALQRWMKRHGVKASPKAVKILRSHIKARGTKGVQFMEEAGEETQARLPEFIAAAEAAIKRAWDKVA